MSDAHHTRAEQENHAFALMGRLHVTLRRHSGRVTDIEYMRIDPGYCRYVLEMTAGSDNADLHELSTKLQEIFFGDDGLFTVLAPRQPLLSRLAETPPAPAPQSPAATPGTDDEVDRGYIGRLR
ncbi:hypothetical protein [Oxalicibacterium solurbis]|uniref:Uncharacterized protein n=1 Tax=Oxalicibacterium solurbis TaxID=69280 RepID=A0A8J3B2P4_9BURK|nr:hypothetical protein [Oxalicibacterium solurbis]GGI53978.1 hypothetical protein GCM10011430_11520 [Oxalicibacterium solurbis]